MDLGRHQERAASALEGRCAREVPEAVARRRQLRAQAPHANGNLGRQERPSEAHAHEAIVNDK